MSASRRRVCVHGHFYQPPREDPWSGVIERQASAEPYHDWNERITAECYEPMARARIDGDVGVPDRRVNNYARISFNFGPTLMCDLQARAPATYRAILDADCDGSARNDGHGNALAQAYNHTILPLTRDEDRRCQVAWGIRDFEQRFGRRPEGLWLPETAVDLATLDVLAAADIRFTLLAPHQARRVRAPNGSSWRDLDGDVDTTRAYLQQLPSGRSIALFFYDGTLSSAVAFDDLLEDGKTFADRILASATEDADEPRLIHLATDGETYGHHRRFGEMALAWALEAIDTGEDADLTNYAAFLAAHPPTWQVEIAERSSWSCHHGVARWHGACACGIENRSGWNTEWRAALREALDWLHEALAAVYERRAAPLLSDPQAARLAYIDVLLDPSEASRSRYLAAHAKEAMTAAQRDTIWSLQEMQRHAMLMYTSCGWFFEDPSRIETLQVLRYAARAVGLAKTITGRDLEPDLLTRLTAARSNHADRGTAANLYRGVGYS